MLRRIMLTILLAGGLAGGVAFGLQSWKIVPLLLEAEGYEESSAGHGHPGIAHTHAVHDEAFLQRAAETAAPEEWAPGNGLQRAGYTLLADLLAGIGFAALLVGAIALSGRDTGLREGLFWGMAGFAAFTVAPGLGLPPELPGMMAADLTARQIWWGGTAVATAAGIALAVFPQRPWLKASGVILVLLPQIIGAPQGPVSSAVPPELMARFASASFVTAGVFWGVLGSLAGAFYRRFEQRTEA